MVNVESFRQLSFLSSILMGFSLTVVVQLLAMNDKRRIVQVTIIMFWTATSLFFLITFAEVMLLINTAGLSAPYPQQVVNFVDRVRTIEAAPGIIGFAMFIIGITLIGWIHSKFTGIITTGVALLVVCFMGLVVSALP